MKRPFLPVLLWYTGGAVAGAWLALPLSVLFAAAFATFGFALLSARARPWLLGPLLLLSGWTNLLTKTATLSPIDLRRITAEQAELATVRGRLTQTPTQRVSLRNGTETWRTLAVIGVEAVNRGGVWERAHGTVTADMPGLLTGDYFAGRTVEVFGVLQVPPGPAAPGLFDYRAYLRWQGIYRRLQTRSISDWKLVPCSGEPPERPWSDRFISWAQQTLARGLPIEDEPLQLLWAMTLGWKTALTDEVSEPFMRTGTMHIFAISGLHVAIISGILVALLRVMQVPRRFCGLIVVPLIWFYAAATGWQPSAIRSSMMMTVVIVGWALHRPGDLLNSLAAAGFIILVWEPRQLFQAGFQLSFFVVLSMALLGPPLRREIDRLIAADPSVPRELLPGWRHWLIECARKLAHGFVTSLSAWLGSLPLIALYFHLVTPVSLVANLVIVPLSGLALTSTLGSLFCGFWCQWLSVLFNHSAWLWMRLMVLVSEQGALLPGAFFHVPTPHFALVCAYYLLLVALAIAAERAWHWRLLLGGTVTAAFLALAAFSWTSRGEVAITVLPLRGGHAVLVDRPGRAEDVLIDCGDESSARFVVKPFLESHGIGRLPFVLVTHGDIRHAGGWKLITEAFRVGTMGTGQKRSRSPTYRQLLDHLAKEQQRWCQLGSGDVVAGLKVLHPQISDTFALADDNALVLQGEVGGVRFLFLSDLGPQGQAALIERGGFEPGGIVIAGLPARGEPLTDQLFELVQPSMVVVADSDWPMRERAGEALRQRLERTGVQILFTSDTGAVTIRAKNGRWSLDTMRAATAGARTEPSEQATPPLPADSTEDEPQDP